MTEDHGSRFLARQGPECAAQLNGDPTQPLDVAALRRLEERGLAAFRKSSLGDHHDAELRSPAIA